MSTSESDPLILRVRRRMYLLGALEIAGSFLFGWRPGLSLTIAAAVVIFSFLAFEKLTLRLSRQPEHRAGLRTLVPLLLVTAASLVLFAVVLFRWKQFDPIAGAVGLSTVVLAIVPEVWIGRP
jgi:multisubunit Na+/H+ antiporter MnhB subunit